MNILLIGDGPLAHQLSSTIDNTHHLTTLLRHHGANGTPTEMMSHLEALIEPDIELAIEVMLAEPTEKWDAITELDRLLPSDTPILTAALNASATEVASWCHHPERVVGFATLPPLTEKHVIEFMPALQSHAKALERVHAFWQSLAWETVEISDSVGGVLPRVMCNIINEAAFALMEKVATPEDIDLAMQLGTNYPRGPLAWADLIGLDQVIGILEALGNEFGTDQYRPAPLLRQYERAKRTFYAST